MTALVWLLAVCCWTVMTAPTHNQELPVARPSAPQGEGVAGDVDGAEAVAGGVAEAEHVRLLSIVTHQPWRTPALMIWMTMILETTETRSVPSTSPLSAVSIWSRDVFVSYTLVLYIGCLDERAFQAAVCVVCLQMSLASIRGQYWLTSTCVFVASSPATSASTNASS